MFVKKCGFLFALLLSGCICRSQLAEVSIVASNPFGAPVQHGLNKLKQALSAKQVAFEQVAEPAKASGKTILIVGLAGSDANIATLLSESDRKIPATAEALSIRKTTQFNKPAWVVAGYDDRGLMYALLDVAERIGWASDKKNVFSRLREVSEAADVKERAVVIYTMNRAYWESRFYDTEYWTQYLDMMAADRLNMLEVGFGFENGGFLAPAYPYFFDLEIFPNVRMGDITAAQQKKNLDAFNHLIRMCHDRGIGFRVGFWDHIYRGGYQSNKDLPEQVNSQVQGVTVENMIPYTKAALARFIDLVPALDGILFRAHDESGLKKGEQLNFWKAVFDTLAVKAPKLMIDLHAKEVSDTIVHEAQKRGLTVRMSTKYWMEQMGLPFHPTHTNRVTDNSYRRHGYADMLNYEEHYPVFYRIWGGTTRVLLWGDPEYARRFAATTHIHDGAGFGVNEPLTTKMHAQPHDAKPFDLLKPQFRYYDYEFQRYWNFYQTFGRIGYNPSTPAEVWDEAFKAHLGATAGPVLQKAMYKASWVLPRIVASCFPLIGFPIASGWAEKQHMEDLPVYAKTTPSDVQQFASFDEEAQLLIEKGESAKLLPSRNSNWFKHTAEEIDRLVLQAEKQSGKSPGKEFVSTVTDLKILSGLALYHSRRIPAAVSYRLYSRTGDSAALDEAINHERNAIEAWKKIIAAAGDLYADTLMMGPRKRTLVGHWRQELDGLLSGLSRLQQERSAFQRADSSRPAPNYKPLSEQNYARLFQVGHQSPGLAPKGKPFRIVLQIKATNGLQWARLLYREVNQYKEFNTVSLEPTGTPNEFAATIPGDFITGQWDLMYLFEVMDNQQHGAIYPDMDKETPYVVVKTN